jgi:simple sugar transport system substrate-binding protein
MTYKHALLAGATALGLIAGGGLDAQAADAPGKGVTIYMQMGGNPGDGTTLARQTGAAAAAAALGVDKLSAQFSAWAPEKMIAQFKEALAARPSCFVIMGHLVGGRPPPNSLKWSLRGIEWANLGYEGARKLCIS